MYIFAKNTWRRKRRHRCRLGRVRYTYYNYSVQVGAKLPFDGQVSTPQPHVRSRIQRVASRRSKCQDQSSKALVLYGMIKSPYNWYTGNYD